VTPDIETAIKEYAAGKLEFRNDAGGNIHMPVGKTDFPVEDLVENVEAAMAHMTKLKPSAAKGTYMKKVVVSATRTPGVEVTVGN
jgi:large subunit ribosomal protein L1